MQSSTIRNQGINESLQVLRRGSHKTYIISVDQFRLSQPHVLNLYPSSRSHSLQVVMQAINEQAKQCSNERAILHRRGSALPKKGNRFCFKSSARVQQGFHRGLTKHRHHRCDLKASNIGSLLSALGRTASVYCFEARNCIGSNAGSFACG